MSKIQPAPSSLSVWRPQAPTSFLLLLYVMTFTTTLTPTVALTSSLLSADGGYSVQCGVCDPSRCPQLRYCEGQSVKDSCNCCTVCSSPKYQPHVAVVREDKCSKVRCSKFEVCVANMQGLPLCKCPSKFLCRSNRKRTICGADGQTYESKCHMRIASCNQNMMIRKKHRGVCTPKDIEDGVLYKKRMRRKMRRRERRRQRMEKTKAASASIPSTGGRVGGGELILPGQSEAKDEVLIGEIATKFGASPSVFDDEARDLGISHRTGGNVGVHLGGIGDAGAVDKSRNGRTSSRRKQGRRKRRKQRKLRKRTKKDKKERRKRRRKRQHRPKSRSKRHRMLHGRQSRYYRDHAARERKFEEAFGVATWKA